MPMHVKNMINILFITNPRESKPYSFNIRCTRALSQFFAIQYIYFSEETAQMFKKKR